MLQPPFIVVDASTDVYFYKSVDDLSRDLEAIDVRNGEYRVYDRDGQPGELLVETRIVQRLPKFLGGGPTVEAVVVKPSAAAPDPAELVRALNKALDNLPDKTPGHRPSTLPALIDLAISKYGFSP